MSKNIVIFWLGLVIVILVGVVLFTNYQLFSEVWLAGLVMIIVPTVTGILIAFKKIRKNS